MDMARIIKITERKNMKKKHFVIILSFLLLFACAQTDVANSDYDTIIDVRPKKEYDAGHLKNAMNIPYTKVKEEIQKHVKDKNTKILLYCRSGRRSGMAERILKQMGYVNVVNAGAFKKLKKQELERKQEKLE